MRQITRILGLILAGSLTAAGQQPDSARAPRSFWASGMSIGVPGARNQAEGELFTIGGNFTQVHPGVGADISLFTMPRVIPEGMLPAIGRLGLAVPVGLGPDAYFIPSAGLVVATIAGTYGMDGTAGVYGGGALLILGAGGGGMRAAYTIHRLAVDASIWHLEIGFVRRAGAK